jgi:hypothetical protein
MLAAVATAESDTQPAFEPLGPNLRQRLLDGSYAELREQMREVLCRPEITREVNRPCNDVRSQAAELVDAFGIPDRVLGAPIGVRDPSAAVRG